MKRFSFVITLPLVLCVVGFAVANRSSVRVSFDPFSEPHDAWLAFDAPLYLVLLFAVLVGIVLGGVAAAGTLWKRARRRARRERAARNAQDETN